MFSIQYFPHKWPQTHKVTVFSSYLAQSISFIFMHPLNRNKHNEICFSGEHSRQHNTSQKCNFYHEYVQKPIYRLQEQIKGHAYGKICITVRHPRCGHQKKNPLDTLEPPEDHRVCTKKLIWPKLEVCFRLRHFTLDMFKSFHCMPKASKCLGHQTQLCSSSLTSASLECKHPSSQSY